MSQTYLHHALSVHTGSPITKLLLISLADLADSHGCCFPSYDYLAKSCHVSVRSIKTHIKVLIQQGHVQKQPRFANGRQRSNIFQLQFSSQSNGPCSLAPPSTPALNEELTAPITNKQNKHDLEQGNSQPPVITLLALEGETPIDQEFYQLLVATYPALDVQQELQAMRMWLYLNEKKRRSRETIKYFINSWLRGAAKSHANRVHIKQRVALPDHHGKRPEILERCFADYQNRENKHPIEARIQAIVAQKQER